MTKRVDDGGLEIDRRGCDCAMGVPADAGVEAEYLLLPDAGGVAIFEDGDARAVMIATTGSLRGLARRRLSRAGGEAVGARTDYRAVCARVVGIVCESSLEAEAVYLRQTRERMPLAYATVIERWRAWMVRVDPDAQHPEWSKTNLGHGGAAGDAKARSASKGAPRGVCGGGVLIGPIRDKDAAARVIELAVDGFDLCRYPNLLQQSPQATACAYKEMGRCPAPCDGSESLESYRARVREAASGVCASTRQGVRNSMESRMQAAALAGEYEHAARCKRAIDAMTKMESGMLSVAEDLSVWGLALLLRSRKAGVVRVLLWAGLRLEYFADVRVEDAKAGAQELGEALARRAQEMGTGVAREPADHVDHIAVIARWLMLPAKKRRGEAMRLDQACDDRELARVIARIGRPATLGQTSVADEIDDQSVESM